MGAERSPPPPPPPPPPPQDPRSKISPYILKLRQVPYTFLDRISDRPTRPGPYFFYGTLMDPSLVRELLELDHEPEFRPAYIEGYECKRWGSYPALVEAPGSMVEGAAYQVTTEEHAARLAFYETNNYRADPCCIYYRDGKEPAQEYGYTFMFVGNKRDLRDGGV